VRPTKMVAGDVLVLTKPLGTQLGVNLRQWTKRPSPLYKRFVEGHMATAEIDALYESSVASMAMLNRNAAALMKAFGAHACTDVTGFGILGHSRNLALSQDARVEVVLEALPILEGAVKGETLIRGKYKLLEGLSAETSGGLLIAFPSAAEAQGFRDRLWAEHLQASWVVGKVVERAEGSTEGARIADDADVINVPSWPASHV
jgi:selenide, water dikinase